MTEPRNPPSETGTDGFEGDPFFELGLAPTIVDDAAAAGLQTPTPIQQQAIPAMLSGRDLIGIARAHRDIGAFTGQRRRDRPPDAARAAEHDGVLAFETEIHC